MSVKVQTVNTDKFKMKYFKFGSGDKPAVIIPGLSLKSVSETADSVASAYRAMNSDYTVYVFDRRLDCGEVYTVEDMADDTIEAFDILGIKHAYVFGVSQGGMIAQYITLKRPDIVKKLALGSTAARITEQNSCAVKNWARLAEEKKTDALIDSFLNAVYSNEFSEQFGKFIKELLINTSDLELERFAVYAKACDGFDLLDELDKINCPIFVIGAENDNVLGAQASVELAEKANARLYMYENYGHAVYDEAPDYLDRIIKFFAE